MLQIAVYVLQGVGYEGLFTTGILIDESDSAKSIVMFDTNVDFLPAECQ